MAKVQQKVFKNRIFCGEDGEVPQGDKRTGGAAIEARIRAVPAAADRLRCPAESPLKNLAWNLCSMFLNLHGNSSVQTYSECSSP
jgi:hypothetical protein